MLTIVSSNASCCDRAFMQTHNRSGVSPSFLIRRLIRICLDGFAEVNAPRNKLSSFGEVKVTSIIIYNALHALHASILKNIPNLSHPMSWVVSNRMRFDPRQQKDVQVHFFINSTNKTIAALVARSRARPSNRDPSSDDPLKRQQSQCQEFIRLAS
jgi:hypothetical protein